MSKYWELKELIHLIHADEWGIRVILANSFLKVSDSHGRRRNQNVTRIHFDIPQILSARRVQKLEQCSNHVPKIQYLF